VSLLAKAYAGFVGASPPPGSVRRLNPTGYPESQGAFAERVRREAAARLGLPCRVELGMQTDFPGLRFATTPIMSIRRDCNGATRQDGTSSSSITRKIP
jgi:UDP-glucose 4-epimerase